MLDHPPTSPAKIGVLVRTKNRNMFLERALQGIIQQTFSNWHIYIVNDGGDKTAFEHILEKYRSHLDKKVTLAHCDSSCGRGTASALLLSMCVEDYLILHDDDDSLEPTFFQKTIDFLEKDHQKTFCGVTTSNYDVFEHVEGQQVVIDQKLDTMGLKNGDIVDLGLYLVRAFVIIPISFVFRRESMLQAGNVVPGMNFMEDYDFFLRLLQTGEIGIISEFLCSYHHRKPTGTAQDMSRNEKPFNQETAYRNDVIRNAIHGKDNISHLQAILSQNKMINELLINRMAGFIQQLGTAYTDMARNISEMNDKMNRILTNIK